MFNFYQKLKSISLKLDDKIKKELVSQNLASLNISNSQNPDGRWAQPLEENKEGQNKLSFGRLLISRLNLIRFKVFYFDFLSLIISLVLTVVEHLLIIFGDPAKSFNLLYRQHGLSACPIPYATFKKKQKHAKVFSLAGITTIILVTAMSSLLVNLMVGPIEKTLAATYYWTQSSWAGGTSASKHAHLDDGTWSYYASKDVGVVAGTELIIDSTSTSTGDTTTFDTYTSADSSLSVATNNVTLLKPDGAACSANVECQSGACCSGSCCAPIYIFVTSATHDGNFGATPAAARTTADNMCAAEAPSGAQNVHAMMAISATDSPRDMPTNYGYSSSDPFYWYQIGVGPSLAVGTTFDNIIANVVTITATQSDGTGISTAVWVGYDNAGNFISHHSCNSWSTNVFFDTAWFCQSAIPCGYPGAGSSTAFYWLWWTDTSCQTARPIRCMFTW